MMLINISYVFLLICILCLFAFCMKFSKLQNLNMIIMLIILDIFFVSISILFIISSSILNDILGIYHSLILMTIVGIDSACGIAITIAYFKKSGTINLQKNRPYAN